MPALQAVAAAASADERISWWASGGIGGGLQRGSELGAAASTEAVWWGMRLASLLTHLLFFFVRSSPLLVNFGSLGVTGAAAYVRAGGRPTGPGGPATAARVGGHSELGAAA